MPKVIINGRPLIIDGAPALSTDCCCDDPPPPCPNCCVSIDWGTFDGTGDLIDAGYDGMIIKMVMPTKNSRLVCADEQVTITIDILDTESPPTGTPYISWDRHWEYISHTPAVGTDGLVFEEGLIEWGTTTPIAEEYSVTLQLNECWSDNATQYGDIEAGMRGGDFVLITGTSCTSAECCEPEFPCDDCCWYLEPFDNTANAYELDDAGNPVFWAVNGEFGDRAKITIEGTNNGVYCLGEELTIRIKLVPNEYTGDPWIPEVFVTALGGWKHEGHSPDLGNGSLEIGPAPPMSIEWGDDVEGFEYTANIKVPCPVTAPDSLSIGFKNRYPGGPGAASIDIDFACCSGVASEFSCDDCYPEIQKLCCTVHVIGMGDGETRLQDIKDFLLAGGFELNGKWKVAFAVVGYESTGFANISLTIHFVACGDPTLGMEDTCQDQATEFCTAVFVFDNPVCTLVEPDPACFADSTEFEDYSRLLGQFIDPIYEVVVDEPDNTECDPCPPPP